jgi:hypothetical protein
MKPFRPKFTWKQLKKCQLQVCKYLFFRLFRAPESKNICLRWSYFFFLQRFDQNFVFNFKDCQTAFRPKVIYKTDPFLFSDSRFWKRSYLPPRMTNGTGNGWFEPWSRCYEATSAVIYGQMAKCKFVTVSSDGLNVPYNTRGRCYDHNFLRFWTFFAKKLAFLSKTNVTINILHNLALFWV